MRANLNVILGLGLCLLAWNLSASRAIADEGTGSKANAVAQRVQGQLPAGSFTPENQAGNSHDDCWAQTPCSDGTTISCTSTGYTCSASYGYMSYVDCVGYNADGSYSEASRSCD